MSVIRRHRNARGFTLIEVLVALVVLTVGMLGVAVMYVQGLRWNRTSIYHTLAVSLASDMADRIRANSRVPASYAGSGPGADNGCVNGVVICTRADQAEDDWFWWLNDIRTLLPIGAEAEITTRTIAGTSMNRYTITLRWPETGQAQPVEYTLPVQF